MNYEYSSKHRLDYSELGKLVDIVSDSHTPGNWEISEGRAGLVIRLFEVDSDKADAIIKKALGGNFDKCVKKEM